MRKGEVLGLRWSDIDFAAGVIRVRQQLQRIKRDLVIGPLKTDSGQRDLPLLQDAAEPLQQLASSRHQGHGDTGHGPS